MTQAFKNGSQRPKIYYCPAYCGREATEDDDYDEDITNEKIIFDGPMYKDMNTNQTVVDVAEYAAEVLKSVVQLGLETEDVDLHALNPILKDVQAAMAGDGNLTQQIQDYMRSNENLREKVLAIFGGFHLMLTMLKKRGALFEHTHLQNLSAMTRESTMSQTYVLSPGDPTQAETIQMHLGISVCALRKLIYLKRIGKTP